MPSPLPPANLILHFSRKYLIIKYFFLLPLLVALLSPRLCMAETVDLSSWTLVSGINTAMTFYDIWGTSSDDIYVVGGNGMYHYDGEEWSPLLPGAPLRAIHGQGTTVLTAGDGGLLLMNERGDWTPAHSSTRQKIGGVFADSGQNYYAVGDAGTVVSGHSLRWHQKESGTAENLNDICGGAGDAEINGYWFAVGEHGTILHKPAGSENILLQQERPQDLNSVWCADQNYIIAVGDSYLRYNGSSWSNHGIYPDERSYGIWGPKRGEYYIVGIRGMIMKCDDVSCTRMSNKSPSDLHGVWGPSEDEIYAVGEKGTMVHLVDFSVENLPTSTPALFDQSTPATDAAPDTLDLPISGNITHYKYRLDNGDWSQEISVDTNLTASLIMPGQHVLEVKGRGPFPEAWSESASYIWNLLSSLPIVYTAEATDISLDSATLGGDVTQDFGFSVSSRGVCIAQTELPDMQDTCFEDTGAGAGSYTIVYPELTQGAEYFVRAFASSSQGTAWGQQKSFTAPADSDDDTVADETDNCPALANPAQEDSDEDGVGDVCDECPQDPDKSLAGVCGCGVADADNDLDGVPSCNDNCPFAANPEQTDKDGDGYGAPCDCNDRNPQRNVTCFGGAAVYQLLFKD